MPGAAGVGAAGVDATGGALAVAALPGLLAGADPGVGTDDFEPTAEGLLATAGAGGDESGADRTPTRLTASTTAVTAAAAVIPLAHTTASRLMRRRAARAVILASGGATGVNAASASANRRRSRSGSIGSLIAGLHRLCEFGQAARGEGFHGAHADTEELGDRGLAKVAVVPQHHDLAAAR